MTTWKTQITISEALTEIRDKYEVDKNQKLRLIVGYLETQYSPSHTLDEGLFNLAISCLEAQPEQYTMSKLTSAMKFPVNDLLWRICGELFSAEEVETILASTTDPLETQPISYLMEQCASDVRVDLNVFFGVLESVYGVDDEVPVTLFEDAVNTLKNNRKEIPVSRLMNTSLDDPEQYLRYVATLLDEESDDAEESVEEGVTPEGNLSVSDGHVSSVSDFSDKTDVPSRPSAKTRKASKSLEESFQELLQKDRLDAYDLREWEGWQAEKYPISTAVTSLVNYLIQILRSGENTVTDISAKHFVEVMDKWQDRYVRRFFKYDTLIQDYDDASVTRYLNEWLSKLDSAEKVRTDGSSIGIMTERGRQYAEKLSEEWEKLQNAQPSTDKQNEHLNKILEQMKSNALPESIKAEASALNQMKSDSQRFVDEVAENMVSSNLEQARELYVSLDQAQWASSKGGGHPAAEFREALAMSLAKHDFLNESEDADDAGENDEAGDAVKNAKVEPVASIPSSDLDIRAKLNKTEVLDILQTAIDSGMIEIKMITALSDDSGAYRLEDLATDGNTFVLKFKKNIMFSPNSIKTSKEEVEKLEKLWDQEPDVSKYMS